MERVTLLTRIDLQTNYPRIIAFIAVLVILTTWNGDAFGAALRSIDANGVSDPRTARMCDEAAAPDLASDTVHIHCELEQGDFAVPAPAAESPGDWRPLVVAYNFERGMQLDRQIMLLKKHPDFAGADIILASELDRGCSRTGYANVPLELARALDLNYVYGVEYIELPRESHKDVNKIATICEHGNAVFSRHPISSVAQIRHRESFDWYLPPGPGRNNNEPRLGGCMAIAADITIAGTSTRVYSVHFDSGLEYSSMRGSQAAEIVEHARGFMGPVVVGGDMNTITYLSDIMSGGSSEPATRTLKNAGFKDAHTRIPPKSRGTTNREYGMRAIIDLIFVRNADVDSAGICPTKICDSLGDHLPVWTRLTLAGTASGAENNGD